MTNIEKFQALLDSEGIRHFSARELFFRGASNERLNLNTDPPEEMWPNILPAAKALDALRDELDLGIIILSAYRAPAYNRRIGGEKNSFHMQFRALDFRAIAGTPSQWATILRRYRAAGLFSGGIGVYRTFVHVDGRGYHANW